MKPRRPTTSVAVVAALLVIAFVGISGCAHPVADSSKRNAELLLAARRGDTESVKRLLAEGADIEAKNESGLTALAFAADFGHADTTNFLLQQGADPVAGGISGKDALVDTARMGNASKLRLLLQRGADAAAKKEALFAACESEPATIVISPESDRMIEVRQQQESVPLPQIDHAEVARLLLEAGVDLEVRHETGSTPLIWAASFGATDIVKLLLARGANVEAKDNDGDTALIAG